MSRINTNLRVSWAPAPRQAEDEVLKASPLVADEEAEVMAFLKERPAYTFGMAGFIRNNGLVSVHNRGEFYGCRDQEGRFVGVALIGHSVLFEARSENVIAAFAGVAQRRRDVHLLLGQSGEVDTFWSYYADGGQRPRLFCRELLLELRWPVGVLEPVPDLRLAETNDLDLIVPSHARTVVEESGIDPLEVDPVNFRERCRRRIEQKHTWVWINNGKLIFKAEIVSDTPEVIYVEGVEVNPAERGKGYGLRCISQLSRTLLHRAPSVCLLANQRNTAAQAFYRKAGYKLIGYYDSIYLQENTKGAG